MKANSSVGRRALVRRVVRAASSVLVAAQGLVFPGRAAADEGMWLFNQPPREVLRQRYGFEPTDAWLERVQKASVRISTGGSGSLVSEDGLILSNHHVASEAIQKLSTQARNLMRDGFLARTLAEELPCGDVEINVLWQIEDVTARVNAAVPAGVAPEQAAAARRAALAGVEKESLERTGLKSEVVTLYQGGAYHLYRYKRYTDVRLVFAPEEQAAFFGGDPDNFEYPRFCLDAAFFRIWEDGKPAKVEHFLRWNTEGVREGDLVFASGHPGRTTRLLTVAELGVMRDETFPASLERLNREEVLLASWGARSRENARRARDLLLTLQNGRKARVGGLAALQDPEFFGRLVAAETAFRDRLQADPRWAGALAAYDRIAGLRPPGSATDAVRHRLLESGWGFRGSLFPFARTLLRAGDERRQPDGDRLREYRDSNRGPLELGLFSPEPIHDDLEILQLSDSLSYLVLKLGADDPVVGAVLAGKSPRTRAAELVKGTGLRDIAFRKRLYEGGAGAVEAARDPLIEVARAVDAEARRLRKGVESQEEVRRQAHAEIARARFAVQGTVLPPDATGTLRLSFGTVRGYEADGRVIPAFTDMGGMYARAEAQGHVPPFDLPVRWAKRKGRLDLATPFNFISTADIVGGNSGSPTVDREGRLVGLIFDGNLPSLALDFAFEDREARALSVDARAILEALRRVYEARNLVDELTGRRRPRG